MSVSELSQILGNLGEFVGSIGVLVTLVYLAVQIRQNSKQLRLNSYQMHLERYGALISNVLQNSEKFESFRRALNGYESCPPYQKAMFHSHVVDIHNAIKHSRQLVASGTLPQETLLDQERDFARILKSAGGREWMDSLSVPETLFAEVLRIGADEPPVTSMFPFLRPTESL